MKLVRCEKGTVERESPVRSSLSTCGRILGVGRINEDGRPGERSVRGSEDR